MKILIGTHHYPPEYVAGVELLTERLARWMKARGHSVDVLCIEKADAPEPISVRTSIQDGVTVHRLRMKVDDAHYGVRYRDDQLARWFEKFLDVARPDLYHSQSSYLLSLSLVETAKRVGLPVVVSMHDYWYLCPRITLLRSDGSLCSGFASPSECATCLKGEQRRYRWTNASLRWITGSRNIPAKSTGLAWPRDRKLVETVDDRQVHVDRVLHSVDQIVTPARLVQELLLARGFSPDHVRLVRQGMDHARVPVRTDTSPGGPLRIGYAGQVAPHKGLHLLIEAFKSLTNNRATLSMYGNLTIFPQYVQRLKRMAGDDPRIQFRGTYSNADVGEVLAGLDVLVVPSLWYEISPLVILEAFAAGVPPIATDLRNMNYQIRNEQDGLLFEPHSASDLRRQLQRLIDDPALLPKLRAGIRPTHPVSAEMLEIEGIYAAVVERTEAAGAALAMR